MTNSIQGHVDPWWNEDFKQLSYEYKPLKNVNDVERWKSEGYHNVTLNGGIVDMKVLKDNMPDYAKPFMTMFDWEHVGIAFYKMKLLDLQPLHQDHYIAYKKIINYQGDGSDIWRAVIFLEDWKSGHYIEVEGCPILNWNKGDWVQWRYDTPHMAANLGIEDRYTVQITGIKK